MPMLSVSLNCPLLIALSDFSDVYYECYSLFHEKIPIITVYLLHMYALYGKLLGNGEGSHGSKPTDLLCVPPGCE